MTAGNHWLAGTAELSPACFGIVMATGIVSIAAHLLAMPLLSRGLFLLNLPIYAVLWLLTAIRIAWHPRRFFGDMIDHRQGPGFFTMVAGTSVLGTQFVLLADAWRAAHPDARAA